MIYEVIVSKRGDSRNLRQELDMFADALTYWRQRKWKQARRRFTT